MHSVIERPSEFCMSKNEIRYVFIVTDLLRVGLYLEIQLFHRRSDALQDNSFPSFKLVPNVDGKVILTIQQYIDGLLDYNLPCDGTLTKAATKQSVIFWVATREVSDNSLANVPWLSSENTAKRIGLKMGMEGNRYSRNNLLNYLATNKSFLTWQQSKRKVFTNQPLFMSCLLTAGNTTNLSLYVSWKTVQGSANNTTIALSSMTGHIYHIAVDIATLGLTMPSGETPYYWEISVINTVTFATIINPYRFYKDYKPVYNYYDFIYINSLGGIDTARATGEITLSIDRTFDIAEGGFNVENWNSTIKANSTKQVNINLQRKWKGDLGFRQDKQEQQGLIDLLLCLKSYMVLDGKWLPLLNIQTAVEIHKSTDTKWGLPIEWQLAETNESYTPDHVLLGLGSDTENYYGSVQLVIKSLTCNLHYLQGITGFDLPNVYYNNYSDSPVNGAHTLSLTADSISFFATVTGTTTATLLVNGISVETIALPNESYVFFTSLLAITKADIIEIIIT